MPNIPTVKDVLVIAKKERERLRGELTKLEATIQYLESVLEIEPSSMTEASSPGQPETKVFKGISAPKAAERVLREHGRPMHLKKIIEKMISGGFDGQTDTKKLYSNLYTTINKRKPGVFKKVKKATFALKEWDK